MLLRAADPRATVPAKTASVLPARQARCEMIGQIAFCKPECLCRQQNRGSKTAASDVPAIAAMALQHHDRFSCAFVANRTAGASAGKWYLHYVNDPINAARQRFKRLGDLAIMGRGDYGFWPLRLRIDPELVRLPQRQTVSPGQSVPATKKPGAMLTAFRSPASASVMIS